MNKSKNLHKEWSDERETSRIGINADGRYI